MTVTKGRLVLVEPLRPQARPDTGILSCSPHGEPGRKPRLREVMGLPTITQHQCHDRAQGCWVLTV